MKNKKLKIVLIVILSLTIVICGGFYIYTLDRNIANDDVYNMDGYSDAIVQGNMMIFMPPADVEIVENTGIIFYPGGKVEANAYSPLMLKLAAEGIPCILIDMPMNLAIFDVNAADDVYGEFPEIDNWYLMGHSLGGAMASQYVEDNFAKLSGLILLGAYPLNDADVDTIILYGSEDVGLDMEKLVGVPNQYVLEGGNHSYFGNYDENERDGKRDGDTTLTQDEQQDEAVEIVVGFVGE